MGTPSFFRAASALLIVSFLSGVVMMFIRFGSERRSPPWIVKLHGYAAAGAIALLTFGWVQLSYTGPATFALLTLMLAALGGLTLNLGYHLRRKPLPEWLVFAHMAVASLGFLVAAVVAWSAAG